MSAEDMPAVGQAALWLEDVVQLTPLSGILVARQVARLCGEGSETTTTIRRLADAVGRKDSAGRLVAFTESGLEVLQREGWLKVVANGKGCTANTTFRLMPGDTSRLDNVPMDWATLGSAEAA